jgi:hypothetical protein
MKSIQNSTQFKQIPLVWKRESGQIDIEPQCTKDILGLIDDGWECIEADDGHPKIFYDFFDYPEGYIKLWRNPC